jgi:hypothetical protein
LKGRRPDSGPGSMAWFFQAYWKRRKPLSI